MLINHLFAVVATCAHFLSVRSAAVGGSLQARQDQNQKEILNFFEKQRARLKIVNTTKTPNGQEIDWIPIGSQGKIAAQPPKLAPVKGDPGKSEVIPLGELELKGAQQGPPGTVPVLKQNLDSVNNFTGTLAQFLRKEPPAQKSGKLAKRIDWVHWYAQSSQRTRNFGGQGQFSCFEPGIEINSDGSLLQIAVTRRPSKFQTVEAGWIKFPRLFGEGGHLFTYFTTCSHCPDQDYIGGWNDGIEGWVQVDSAIHPGTRFSPTSVIDGAQFKLWIVYQLFEGNWWLWVKDRWIGYYPASLFSGGGAAGTTLATSSDEIYFYGEIFDSDERAGVTTTDMGSGRFADQHWQKSAYIHNILFQSEAGPGNSNRLYNGNEGLIISDTKRYTFESQFGSSSSWDSYCWLGGPGKV